MPVYLFSCPNCKAELELSRNVHSRDEMARCVNCLTPMVRKPTTAAFQVNGYNATNHYSKETV